MQPPRCVRRQEGLQPGHALFLGTSKKWSQPVEPRIGGQMLPLPGQKSDV